MLTLKSFSLLIILICWMTLSIVHCTATKSLKVQKNQNLANVKEVEEVDGIIEGRSEEEDEDEDEDYEDDEYDEESDVEDEEEDNNVEDDFNEMVNAAKTMASLIKDSNTTIEELNPFLHDLYKDYKDILNDFVTNFKYFSALYPTWKNIVSVQEDKTQEKINNIALYQRLFAKYAIIQKRFLNNIGKFTELQTALLPYTVFPCEISKDEMTEAYALAANDVSIDNSSEGIVINQNDGPNLD
ncbi:uncharacterized protein LOC126908144 [Daktulosphaira vitifoliae]|uniref:uncharacterized protein LOC126908144 n=1 Tax=Daktulosphaira vitifoliae TaxID=58002 RepID=UPI0021AACB45|nr:uncharacterized protein LOC126908144 [Daktulosphaira vitifoliae]